MSVFLIIAKAICLIALAAVLFFGFAIALDASAFSAPQQRLCVGQPLTGCFLTII